MAVDKLLILQNIQTTLEAITIANGYRTNVETVEPVIRVWGEALETHSMPWLGYGATETRPDPYLPGNQIMCKMPVSIVAHINEVDAEDAQTTICGLEDDILHAMLSSTNTQRGSDDDGPNAIDTKWIRTVDNVPDPTIASDGGLCMVMEFEIEWARTTSRSAE